VAQGGEKYENDFNRGRCIPLETPFHDGFPGPTDFHAGANGSIRRNPRRGNYFYALSPFRDGIGDVPEITEEALKVLLKNPEAALEAKELIEANKDSIQEVLKGRKGVIYNTDKITFFLDGYTEKSPASLKILVSEVKKEMIKSQEQGEPFLGFWLEKEKIK
jgi:hypothetical protein